MKNDIRYLIQSDSGFTMVFNIKACAEVYALIYKTNVVEVSVEIR